MCGEHRSVKFFRPRSLGSSPHVRGARSGLVRGFMPSGIIPACAGSTSEPPPYMASLRDHPRMCGEHDAVPELSACDSGSSPHVRGAQGWFDFRGPVFGIIPACAGSTRYRQQFQSTHRDHPRMCGEHDSFPSDDFIEAGSSPHVRGAPLRWRRGSFRCGIIPACAGSTPTAMAVHRLVRDHPRMCGEHDIKRWDSRRNVGSSPHVRGALLSPPLPQSHGGIIPACAGSTCACTRPRRDARDHPRMCGEHSKG